MSYNGNLYAIGLGTDVALASLRNVQALLFPYNQVTSADAKMNLGVVSQPPNYLPIRIQTLDAQESGQGVVYHTWDIMLTAGGVNFWLNYLWAAVIAAPTASISTAVTIYTRQSQFSNYTRQNCYAIFPTLPTGENDTSADLIYTHRRGLFRLRQRFNDLIPST